MMKAEEEANGTVHAMSAKNDSSHRSREEENEERIGSRGEEEGVAACRREREYRVIAPSDLPRADLHALRSNRTACHVGSCRASRELSE